jgi:hypothetical protein
MRNEILLVKSSLSVCTQIISSKRYECRRLYLADKMGGLDEVYGYKRALYLTSIFSYKYQMLSNLNTCSQAWVNFILVWFFGEYSETGIRFVQGGVVALSIIIGR